MLNTIVLCAVAVATAMAIDVDNLLASMSLEEKIGQMVQLDISLFMTPSGTVNYDDLRSRLKQYKVCCYVPWCIIAHTLLFFVHRLVQF